MSSSTDQNVIKKLGKYEIVELVGRGAMGEVYKAHDPLIGRMVALKTITSGLAGRPDLLERFQQEARSAGTLQHPNIVTIFELGQEGETPFIAMEFLEGESLEGVIERRPAMTVSHKLSHIVPVCRALDYAHRRGIVHRDIKPANVMITKDGRVKVVDFGIARLTDSSMTQTNTIIGTLGYMSPQQIRGERADERSDIWATGVMLYEILTYQRPFEGANQAALMMNISSEDVLPASIKNFVPDAPVTLDSVVSRMLAKNLDLRYQTMEQVLRDFERVLRRLQNGASSGTASARDEASHGNGALGSRANPELGATVISAPAQPHASAPSQPEAQTHFVPPQAASAPPGFLAKVIIHKKPLGVAAGVLAFLLIMNLIFRPHPSAAPEAPPPAAAAPAASVAPDLPAPEPVPHNEPIAPGVVATVAQLAPPWAAKDFVFHNDATGEFIPSMVVHLPRGGYWGFSMIAPYGRCHLEYVTDLQKLANDYGYPSDHPLVADPCNKSLFDLLRYGGPMGAEVRGDIVRGMSLRPPLAIEIQQRGNSILATKMEE
jgi:eukaryotic-like serine/threonine-protein kinase